MGVPLTRIVIGEGTYCSLSKDEPDGSFVYTFRQGANSELKLMVRSNEYIVNFQEQPVLTGCAVLVRERRGEFDTNLVSVTSITPFPGEFHF